ncbi:MAG: helix-turn-helix transcriptional regulator [Kiritimatiellae bacterium]|nr:helix-turn-helix transcriptional regulator [Kiritimatiellia bacterium]
MNSKELGSLLKKRRKQLKLTQRDVASTCVTGLRFIGDLENGKPTCQLAKTLDVIQALGLAIHFGVRPPEEKHSPAVPEWRVW